MNARKIAHLTAVGHKLAAQLGGVFRINPRKLAALTKAEEK